VIAAQLPPPASQRRHSYAYAVGPPDHEPGEDASGDPTTAVPETVGGEVFTGPDPHAPVVPSCEAIGERLPASS
jgi:hypothetical protein